jgi:predicted RNA-binding Zn-ribbon protein involved in translation (DUF1610 family)
LNLRTKIKLVANATLATGLITVLSLFALAMNYLMSREAGRLIGLFGVLAQVCAFVFLILVFLKASTAKCPKCGKQIQIGYGAHNLENFIVPDHCVNCGHKL